MLKHLVFTSVYNLDIMVYNGYNEMHVPLESEAQVPKPKRTPHQREADTELANRLHLQGLRNWQIAERISAIRPYSITNAQVGYDLAKARARWQEQTAIALDEAKQRELERLDLVEREYWEQFEESKLDRKGGTKAGDPLYLQGIERCVELRMKLLGLEAPKQTHISGRLDIEHSAKLSVLAKVEAMAERISLYPSGGPTINHEARALGSGLAADTIEAEYETIDEPVTEPGEVT